MTDTDQVVLAGGLADRAGPTLPPPDRGWDDADWHRAAGADTGVGYVALGRAYVIRCAWCPATFLGDTRAEALGAFREHERERLDAPPAPPDEPEWVPGRWWRVIDGTGRLWCETSSERDARQRLPGATQPARLERLEQRTGTRWVEVET